MTAIIVLLCIIVFLGILCLSGLLITGKVIGWGPFQDLKWNSIPQYLLSEKEYPYTMEEKTIYVDNQKIAGTLYLPDNGKEKQPIVIVSHGYASISKTNMYACKSLAKSGLCVFSFDYRGGAYHAKSDGKTTDMSVLTEKKDLNTVIDEVKTWDFVDRNKMMVMGYSQGGLVAALTAGERDDIHKLLLVFPAFSMVEEIKKEYSSLDEIPTTVERMGMKIGKKYFADILSMDFDVYEEAAKYEGEVLIIHGTEDKAVPYSSSVKAQKTYKNCELFTIEGGSHGFENTEYDLPFLTKSYEFLTE